MHSPLDNHLCEADYLYRHEMSVPTEDDDWIFDTIKPATIRPPQFSKHTIKRRKLSKIISDDDAENTAAMMQSLDLGTAPLASDSPTYSPEQSSTIRTPKQYLKSPTQQRKSSALTARRLSGSTPTARRVSRQASGSTPTARRMSTHAKQPLGLDMSFGNGTSTVRQFRRVSSAGNHHVPRNSETAIVHISEDFQEGVSDENLHPAESAPEPVPVTKESILGRRAYVKCVDPALQESYASTAPGPKQAALARLAEAWCLLDEVDPEGELLLLKTLFDRVQNDPKLAAQVMPTRVAAAQLASLRLASPTKRSSAVTEKDVLATPPISPQKRDDTPKLILAPQNPHLRALSRQQSTAGPEKEKERPRSRGGIEDKLPGNVEAGLEHVGLLADALYGRWSEGLRMRWPLA